MTVTTILFETITAARKAYDTLQPMIDVSLDCNALTYSELDEELVKWLISDRYCQLGDKKRIYPYPVSIISKYKNTTLYKYQDLQIEQKFIPPADWEFTTCDRLGKIINSTWWGYEDGSIDIGFYIENFLKRCLRLGFANRVILAWGNHGSWRKQDLYTLELLKNHDHLYSLGITKQGCPRHPLSLRSTTKPQIYDENKNIV